MSNNQEETIQPQLPNLPESLPQNIPEKEVQEENPSSKLPAPFEFINKINEKENNIENQTLESNTNNQTQI